MQKPCSLEMTVVNSFPVLFQKRTVVGDGWPPCPCLLGLVSSSAGPCSRFLEPASCSPRALAQAYPSLWVE